MKYSVLFTILMVGHIGASMAGQIQPGDFNQDQKIEVNIDDLQLNFFGGTPPLTRNGVTFSTYGGLRVYPAPSANYSSPYEYKEICVPHGCLATNFDLETITATLSTPASAVGAYVGIFNVTTTARAEFYSGTSLLGAIDVFGRRAEAVYVGWDAGSALITSVKFIDTSLNGFVLNMTEFTYQVSPLIASVPEPTTYAMLGLGLGFIGVAARRRKTA